VSDEWPTMQSELSRKALDTLDRLTERFAIGEIDKTALRIGIDTLYDTISGLVPWDIADLVYRVRTETL
jgi:hypothetical protein